MAPRPYRDFSDEDLVARAKAGDQLALSEIFERYAAMVMDLSTRMLRRRSEADDVVQDTFTAVLQSISTLEDGKLLKPWIITTAIHRVRRRFRSQAFSKWIPFSGGRDENLESHLLPEAGPEVRAELNLVQKVFDQMTTDERIAFSLRRIEGFELQEVADAMELSLATVKRRVADAEARIEKFVLASGTKRPSRINSSSYEAEKREAS